MLQQGVGVVRKQNVTMRMEVFHCAVCAKPLRPPIFQCSSGTSICSPCYRKLPVGEHDASKRSYTMERVVESILVPCKLGCNMKMAYYRQDAHERECLMGPCVCPVSGCSFVAPAPALLGHLTTLHQLPTAPVKLFVTFLCPVKPVTQVLSSECGRLFLLHVEPVESFGHAVSLTCVRPQTPREVVVSVQFSSSEGHFQASKLEFRPDAEPRQCLCVVPGGGADVLVSIKICLVYSDNDELHVKDDDDEEEEDDDDQDYDYDDDEEE